VKPVAFASIVVRGIALWLVLPAFGKLGFLFTRWNVDQLPPDVRSVVVLSIAGMECYRLSRDSLSGRMQTGWRLALRHPNPSQHLDQSGRHA
jgi:hypothetical protein